MSYRRINPSSVIFNNEVSNNGMSQDTALGYLTNEQVTGLGEAQRKIADSLTARDEQDFNYAQAISALLRGDSVNNRQIDSSEKIAKEGDRTQTAINQYSVDNTNKREEADRNARLQINEESIKSTEKQAADRLALDKDIAAFEESVKKEESNRLSKKDTDENERYQQEIRFKTLKFAYQNAQKGIKPTLSPTETIDIIKAQEAIYRKDTEGQVIGIDVNPVNLTNMSAITYPSTGLLYASLKLKAPITYKLAGGGTYTLENAPVAVPKVEDWKNMSYEKKLGTNRIVAEGIKSFVEKTVKMKMNEEEKKAIVLAIFEAYDSYLGEEKDSKGMKKHATYLKEEDEETRTFIKTLEEILTLKDSETKEKPESE